MKVDIKNCPFCGSEDIYLKIDKFNLDRQYIECDSCGIEVSYSDCIKSAIDIWNKRV